MQDFACKNPDDMHYKELADSVRYFKTTKEGELDMTDVIELYAENKARKAEQAERINVATVMLKNHESIEKILLYTKLSQKEVDALAAKLSA